MKKFFDELIVYGLFLFCIILLLVVLYLDPVSAYLDQPFIPVVELKNDT